MDLDAMLRERLTFRYWEPLEFLISMGMIACEDAMRKLAEDYKVEFDPLMDEFLTYARENLSAHTMRELKFFLGHDFFHKSFDISAYQFLTLHPELDNVEAFLEALKKEPLESLIGSTVLGVYYDRLDELMEGESWETKKQDLPFLLQQVKKVSPMPVMAGAHQPLLECLSHPEEARQRFLLMMEQVHLAVFAPWRQRISAITESAVSHYRSQFEEDPSAFIRFYNKATPDLFALESRIVLHVSFCLQMGNHNMSFDGFALYLFGIFNEKVFGPEASLEKLERFFKAMSDKRRLAMLQLLLKRPHYGTELAEALGITPAAVNYHANFFFFLDLLQLKRDDHRLYYHVDQEKMKELLQLAGQMLLKE
ncbi:ArsR family transcriptional regulator [Gorillibacterium sp. CAU 1737]|uniref:ArsR/SmtB family transcription factor n=1 Tax=Gorillibacterium sp. CAU 1737 TaxID=3140362 RepID=UPI00326187CC